jgi:molecular chaperone HtpG
MTIEKFEFKAEVKELLNLVINSLYSNKDIFLRELISNASDAIDKARYLSLTNQVKLSSSDFKIKIIPDKDKKTLTISDNGIGMSKDDLINNIGTIAKSGTKEFMEMVKKVKETGDLNLVGQFGVGFYSAFMVAEKIDVVTKKAGENSAYKWTSKADGNYEIEETARDANGTDIILYLKNDAEEYLDEWKIKSIVKKYSDYIEYPIVMDVEKDKNTEEETLNSRKAIWMKDKSDIKDEEYKEFYKHISHDFNDPLDYIHFKAEGTLEFTALLYIPSKKPFDIYYKDYKMGPSLYVKKVQIMDACEELIEPYLRFVKGVVESNDLPLNVSREMLQNNRVVTQIKNNITKKVLSKLEELKKNNFEKYEKFYSEFGNILKEGIHFDFSRKEEIAELLIFNSLKNQDKKIDFNIYIENMPENQKEIYYITGESVDEIKISPHLEYFKENNIDVIFLTDEIDGIIMNSLMEFKKKKVKSILKGDIEIDENLKKEKETKEKEYKGLLEKIKEDLKDYVKDVKAGVRLKNSLCCLVGDENEMDETMKRILESMGQTAFDSKKILEINLEHPVMKKVKSLYEVDPKSTKVNEYSKLIYDLALILDGEKPVDPVNFATKISEFMEKNI